jgi:aspartate/methionine/tyrosine aminotransferase
MRPLADKMGHLGAGIFARLMGRAQASGLPLVPLHLGDSHLPPPEVAAPDPRAPEVHRYGALGGDDALLAAVRAKLTARNGIRGGELQITAGATHAIFCALAALCDPGDEVILPAPFWPLVRGIARVAGLAPVEVPLGARPLPEALAPHIGPRTKLLYLATPNNPDGRVASRAELLGLLELARAHDLWILSDEVYEDLVYDGAHVSIASLPGAAERTVSVWSFSKSYAQAGLRVGYLSAPPEVTAAVRRISTHTIYNPPVWAQRLAAAALASGPPAYAVPFRAARDLTVSALAPHLPVAVPPAGTFLFLELAPGMIERLADGGVLLAPGDAFGEAFAGWARLCFTAIPPAELAAGLARMVDIVRRGA